MLSFWNTQSGNRIPICEHETQVWYTSTIWSHFSSGARMYISDFLGWKNDPSLTNSVGKHTCLAREWVLPAPRLMALLISLPNRRRRANIVMFWQLLEWGDIVMDKILVRWTSLLKIFVGKHTLLEVITKWRVNYENKAWDSDRCSIRSLIRGAEPI